jgi:hypothetical protein
MLVPESPTLGFKHRNIGWDIEGLLQYQNRHQYVNRVGSLRMGKGTVSLGLRVAYAVEPSSVAVSATKELWAAICICSWVNTLLADPRAS